MKTIGIIGGMSWQSSTLYYQYTNELIAAKLGGFYSAKILMTSVNFNEINTHFTTENWHAIGELMAFEASRLEKAGADCIVLATNTIHLVADYITNAIEIPFIHIAEATAKAIQAKQYTTVALLGTKFTMEKDFYQTILTKDFGIQVVTPNETERNQLQELNF